MNVVKKNTVLITLYLIQSVALIVLLASYAIHEITLGLYLVVLVIFVVKVIIAPMIFMKIIKQSKLNISASTYLNVPMTIGMLAGISIFAQSEVFSSFSFLLTSPLQPRLFLFGGLLISLFLIVNRKGVISEVVGMLSLENFIYSTSLFLGVKQLLYLELGILFDVLFWIIIARVLVNFIYKHYKSLEVTELSQLKK
jgi:hydrogenase-4 membrane subunit HyfE